MLQSSLMPTRIRLKSLLDKHDITIYALQKMTEKRGNRVSYQALHALANNPNHDSVRLKTLDAVIDALRVMTQEPLTVCDLLEYE